MLVKNATLRPGLLSRESLTALRLHLTGMERKLPCFLHFEVQTNTWVKRTGPHNMYRPSSYSKKEWNPTMEAPKEARTKVNRKGKEAVMNPPHPSC